MSAEEKRGGSPRFFCAREIASRIFMIACILLSIFLKTALIDNLLNLDYNNRDSVNCNGGMSYVHR